MAKLFAKSFYGSKEWLQCRAAYIAYRKAIDGGMCESCHRVPGYIVHHKIELTPDNINDPEITLGFENLKYDCHLCHNAEHSKRSPNKIQGMVSYKLQPNGEIIVLPPFEERRVKNFLTARSPWCNAHGTQRGCGK